MIKRIFKYALLTLGILVLAIVTFVLLILLPVDRSPYQQKEFYQKMTKRLDSLNSVVIPGPGQGFEVGFAKENLTPAQRTATAGYGNRGGKKFTEVLDSIYVRAIVISNGKVEVAVVSADLLIIPPRVTEILGQRLPEIGFTLQNTYLNATHTHNSIGNWGEGVASFVYGPYEDSITNFIADKIIQTVKKASANRMKTTIKRGSVAVPHAVRNRVDKQNGGVDSLFHVIEFQRTDNTKLILTSFNAHATCLFSRDLELSRDYPGALVDDLERKGYTFAMFLSGAVGSHGCSPPEYGRPCIKWMADEISAAFETIRTSLSPVNDSSLFMMRIPLELGPPQFKISRDWRLRPWVFKSALGEYKPYLTAFRMGDIILMGTPCDFSGELTGAIRSIGAQKGFQTIITSFNGHYIGYITRDKYYDYDHYETRLMNWYGPGNGAYLTECLSQCARVLTKN